MTSFEIGQYYPEYGIYAGIHNQNHVFVTGHDLREGDKCGFTWNEAMEIAEKKGLRLTTIGECALIAENREAIQKGLRDNGLEKIDGWYWLSLEKSGCYAWVSRFGSGYGLEWVGKGTTTLSVRPVLTFPLGD